MHSLAFNLANGLNNTCKHLLSLFESMRFRINVAQSLVKYIARKGSITAWGYSYWGGTGAPSDSGYTKIYSNAGAPQVPAPPHTVIEPSALRAAKAY
jgi:hypothetical protein